MRIYFSGDNFFHLSLKLRPAPCGPAPAFPSSLVFWILFFLGHRHRRRQTLNGKAENSSPANKKERGSGEKSRLLKSFVYFMCLLCAPFAK